MAESAKRSMSDIRPVRGTLDLSNKSKPSPKDDPKPKPQIAAKPVPKSEPKIVAPDPVLPVEKFKEIEAPKKRSGWWTLLAVLILITAAACATYWVYTTYLVK